MKYFSPKYPRTLAELRKAAGKTFELDGKKYRILQAFDTWRDRHDDRHAGKWGHTVPDAADLLERPEHYRDFLPELLGHPIHNFNKSGLTRYQTAQYIEEIV